MLMKAQKDRTHAERITAIAIVSAGYTDTIVPDQESADRYVRESRERERGFEFNEIDLVFTGQRFMVVDVHPYAYRWQPQGIWDYPFDLNVEEYPGDESESVDREVALFQVEDFE